MAGYRLGVDVGGTFTDLAAVGPDGVVCAKVPSTPDDQSRGVVAAVGASGLDPAALDAFAHGMTVATNALLERRGAPTALVTTEGFRDVLEIGRQTRADLYDLSARRPDPLVPRERRFTVRERCGPQGVLQPLDRASLEAAVEAVRASGAEAVAVSLLFGYLHPAHEQAVGAALEAALPGVRIVLSHRALPAFREYERTATTVASAYLAPRLAGYLRALGERAAAAGLPAPLVMASSGGLIDLELAAANAAACVLSGPAGGVVGAAHVAGLAGFDDVLTLDMGGTSTDVAPIVGGRLGTTHESVIAGVPVGLPTVDVHTVSAGGGSIARLDAGGVLRAGPESAGARPGPASYGLGGTEAAVTDANVALGYLADGAVLGGEVRLQRALAEAALQPIAKALGGDVAAAAAGVVAVANAEMARALRRISVERGLDPRDFALLAFGGAGPLHACALAEELGMRTVLVPRESGVLSALGLALLGRAPRPRRAGTRRRRPRGGAGRPGASARPPSCRARRWSGRPTCATAGSRSSSRWPPTTSPPCPSASTPRTSGATATARTTSRSRSCSCAWPRRAPSPRPALAEGAAAGRRGHGAPPHRRRGRRRGRAGARPPPARRRLGAARPAIVELDGATCLVAPGWAGGIDAAGTLVLAREGG